jgi:hypothetical protein
MIVRYYSRTGNNRKIAEYLAGKLGCDMREIREVGRTDGGGNFMKAIFGTMFGAKPAIEDMPAEDAEADMLVLCTPVWAATVPGAVKTYLRRYRPHRIGFVSVNQDNRNRRPRALGDPSLQIKVPKGGARIEDASAFREELDAFVADVRSAAGQA